MNGSSKALKCPVCFPLLPGIVSREHKEEENGRGKGTCGKGGRIGGREEGGKERGSTELAAGSSSHCPFFLPSPRLATFMSWF